MTLNSPEDSKKKFNTTKIYQTLDQGVKKASQVYKNRWGRLIIQSIIILFSLIYLKHNLSNTKDILNGIQVNYAMLLASWVLTIIVIFLGALGWWLILKGLGQSIFWVESTNIHLISNLAKYIPGFAWQILGKAYLTRRAGIPTNTTGLAITLEIVLIVLTGLLLIIAFLPDNLVGNWIRDLPGTQYLQAFKTSISLTIIILLFSIPLALQKYQARFKTNFINPRFLWGSTITILFGWLLLGLSFWSLGKAIYPIDISELKYFTFALSVSYILGLAIIIIPASIGVRESIMVFILSSHLSNTLAVLIAILSRVIITIGEIVTALSFKLITGWLDIRSKQ